MVGGAVKSLWMRSMLWGNKCKQCYQAGCRRSCPSPNPGPLSRCYFRILNAETLFLCVSRILKNAQTVDDVFVFTDTLNFSWRIYIVQDSAVKILNVKNAANPETKKRKCSWNEFSLCFSRHLFVSHTFELSSQAARLGSDADSVYTLRSYAWRATGLLSHGPGAISFKGCCGLRLTF